jgi:hypothetical protein
MDPDTEERDIEVMEPPAQLTPGHKHFPVTRSQFHAMDTELTLVAAIKSHKKVFSSVDVAVVFGT